MNSPATSPPVPDMMMRAVVLSRHGGPGVLKPTEQPELEPGAGEVRIAVESIGVNYAEVLSRKGLYGWTPTRPYVLGMEAAGRIDQLGAGVSGLAVGDVVLVGRQNGAYAEQIVAPMERVVRPPPGYSMEECAAFGVNFATAWIALVQMARLRPSDRVAITAAAGGVGTAAVQMASAFGCEVIALASTSKKLELARSKGAHIVVEYGSPGFAERLRDTLGGDGLDVVLETVGGDVFTACDAALAPFGRIVVAGYASLDYRLWNPISWWRAWRGAPRVSLESMYKRSTGLLSTHLGYLSSDAARLRGIWDEMVAFVTEHRIRPVVGHVLPLDDVAEAHRLMESRESVGKIVLRTANRDPDRSPRDARHAPSDAPRSRPA